MIQTGALQQEIEILISGRMKKNNNSKQRSTPKEQEIEQYLQKEHDEDVSTRKIILLGTANSGKSTFLKQLKFISGTGFSGNERNSLKTSIQESIIISMKHLLELSRNGKRFHGMSLSPENQASKDAILEMKDDFHFDDAIAEHVHRLWSDPLIKQAFVFGKDELPESVEYFFDRVKELAYTGYIPTDQDVLRMKVRTSRIEEIRFEMFQGPQKFTVIDVSGQRNERRKWIHQFENIYAVFFLVDISDYDQPLFDDTAMIRMEESMHMFEEICTSKWFKNTSIMLLFNKRDLFEKKILKISLSSYFPNYEGGHNVEAAVKFMTEQFMSRIGCMPNVNVHYQVISALEQHDIQGVFEYFKPGCLPASASGLL
jgi:guanine nucleotide-binding protein G(i) subunit alpha